MSSTATDNSKEIKVSFGKDAFKPKSMFCPKCDIKMKKVSIEMSIS